MEIVFHNETHHMDGLAHQKVTLQYIVFVLTCWLGQHFNDHPSCCVMAESTILQWEGA